MSKPLRPIAIYVEEPKRDSYAWVLIERETADTWREIDRAHRHAPSYQEAMADGLLALQAMSEDLDKGPRAAGPRGGQPPGGEAQFFGFGPAR